MAYYRRGDSCCHFFVYFDLISRSLIWIGGVNECSVVSLLCFVLLCTNLICRADEGLGVYEVKWIERFRGRVGGYVESGRAGGGDE